MPTALRPTSAIMRSAVAGCVRRRQLNQEIEATERQLAAVRAERQELEDKVERLRPGSLDPDLIDELARRRLSLAEPLDVIILLREEGGRSSVPDQIRRRRMAALLGRGLTVAGESC